MRRLLLPFIAVAALVASPAQSLAATTVTVQIEASGFKAKSVTINQGDTVRWINVDKVNHQIVANKGAFASGIIRPGGVYTFTFNTAGGYAYHDALHPSTTGAVYVKGPPPAVSVGVTQPIVTYGEQTYPEMHVSADAICAAVPSAVQRSLPGANHMWVPEAMAAELANFVQAAMAPARA